MMGFLCRYPEDGAPSSTLSVLSVCKRASAGTWRCKAPKTTALYCVYDKAVITAHGGRWVTFMPWGGCVHSVLGSELVLFFFFLSAVSRSSQRIY